MYFYIVIFILSILLTYIVRIFALRKNIMDIPNERSSHVMPTPRGGGLAFVIIWFIGLSCEFYLNNIEQNLYFALLTGLLIVIVGIIDDVVGVRPSIRMIIQLLTSSLALYFLGGLQKVDFGFYELESIYLLTPIALIGFVWFINLFNFLDGIDGYIAVEAITIFAFIYFVFGDSNALLLAIAVLGFLVLNWQPAKIFMGDVGSTLIGFNTFAFMIYYQNSDSFSLIAFLILTGAFWFDATTTLYRRWRNKEQLSVAHKKHAYQRITQYGFSHQKTVIWLLVLNLFLGALAVIAYEYSMFLLPNLLVAIGIMYLVVKLIDKKKAF